MGTDIHSVAQVYKNSIWETKLVRVAGDQRSYNSFAVLANVRNGYGFAGVKTGQGWTHISEARGFPEDLKVTNYDRIDVPTWYYFSDTDKKDPQNDFNLGDHSYSWLLLSEIETYMESIKGTDYLTTGVITKEDYLDLKRGIKPTSWCGGVNGKGIITISENEVVDFEALKEPYTHVQASWKVPVSECLSNLNEIVKELKTLAESEQVSSDKIRFVFGFDS